MRHAIQAIVLALLLTASALAQSVTHDVRSVEALGRAFKQAQPGDVIEIAPGRYNLASLGLVACPPQVTISGAGPERTILEQPNAEASQGCGFELYDGTVIEDLSLVDTNPKHDSVQSSPVVGFARNDAHPNPGLPPRKGPAKAKLRRLIIDAKMWALYDWTDEGSECEGEDLVIRSGRQCVSNCGSGSQPATFKLRRSRLIIEPERTKYHGSVSEGLLAVVTRGGKNILTDCEIDIAGPFASIFKNNPNFRVAGATDWYGTYTGEGGGTNRSLTELHDCRIRIASNLLSRKDSYDVDCRQATMRVFGGSGSGPMGGYVGNGNVVSGQARLVQKTGG